MVGQFGELIFEVFADFSDIRLQSFGNLSAAASARWAVHTPLMGSEKREFLGDKKRTLRFEMLFRADCTTPPRDAQILLDRMMQNGFTDYFYLGQYYLPYERYAIDSYDFSFMVVERDGRTFQAKASVSMTESE
jgi:hypothetical protein